MLTNNLKGDCYRKEISDRCYCLQRSIYDLFEQILVILQAISIKSFYVFVLEFNFCSTYGRCIKCSFGGDYFLTTTFQEFWSDLFLHQIVAVLATTIGRNIGM